MQNLSNAAFNRARAYLQNDARPLERALFAYEFANGSADDVVAELAKYQNPDGGFGHGLEPDAMTPYSSALHTGIALRTLKVIGRGPTDPTVQSAVNYLLSTLDREKKVWAIMPPAVNDAPHAPWWQSEGDSLSEGFGEFRLNPRAEIVGLLHHYADLVPAETLRDVTEDTLATVEAGVSDWHDLLTVVSLAGEEKLPAEYRQRLMPPLVAAAREQVKTDPAAWAEYGGQPLNVAATPDATLAAEFRDSLAANLDFMLTQQREDGAWHPNWDWMGSYDDAWPASERAWSGFITLENLKTLRAFGRLE